MDTTNKKSGLLRNVSTGLDPQDGRNLADRVQCGDPTVSQRG